MSETILTKGWEGPKGECDFCRTRKATHWFGDTSVALCNEPECARQNAEAWDRLVAEGGAAMTDLTPQAHARLSPSGAKGWFACAGRLKMEEPYPNTANEHSDAGTACHEIAAWCLTEHWRAAKRVGDWIMVSHEGEDLRQVCFTEEMSALVQEYVDYVRAAAIGHELLVEQRLEHSAWVAEEPGSQFGTTDAGIVNREQGELMVIDLKAGHVPVNVKTSKQLRIYALGLLGSLYEKAMAAKVVAAEDSDDYDLS